MSKEKLFKAVETNDIGEVKRLLRDWRKESLQELKNGAGLPLLSVAAQRGHEDMVWVLIDQGGLNVNVRDGASMTPFHHAAMFGHVRVLNELGKLPADLSAKDKQGLTALQMAAVHDKATAGQFGGGAIPATVKTLVALGASVPRRPEDWSPYLQRQGTGELQEIVNRGAEEAGKVTAAAKHWVDFVAAAAQHAPLKAPGAGAGNGLGP